MPKVTFRKVHCQIHFCQSVEELVHDLEMFLPGVTVDNRVVNVGFASLKAMQKGMNHPLKARKVPGAFILKGKKPNVYSVNTYIYPG
jgi:hypothetical protein